MIDAMLRRIEKIEERVNCAERDVASVTSKLHLIKDDLARRIGEIDTNLKADAEKTRLDLRERIDDLKLDIKEDIDILGQTIDTLSDTVTDVSKSLQNLYVTQQGSGVKVKNNEKVIWAVIAVLGTIGLYMLQNYIKSLGTGL